MYRRARWFATAGAVAAAIGTAPASAQAYTHSGTCYSLGKGAICYDIWGQLYNPWLYVQADNYPDSREYTCAGAVTAAGNYRTGTGCNYRRAQEGGTSFRYSPISGATPESRALIWWDSVPNAVAVAQARLRAGTTN